MLSGMLPVDPYEWVWLLAIVIVVIGGTYLERWVKQRPAQGYLLSLFFTLTLLAIGASALIIGGREIAAVVGIGGAIVGAWRTVDLYLKRNRSS